MEIDIVLDNGGGALDRERITIANANDNERVSLEIHRVINRWTLSPGDTIRIEEIE